MGSCQSDESVVVSNKRPYLVSKPGDDSSNTSEKPYTRNVDYGLPKFNDMPEWPGEKYRGIGIKQMKGYKCTLPINELQDLREEFWNFKIKENQIWKHIKQACLMDEYRSNCILIQLKMTTANGIINHLVDQSGQHYYIPNFCINDPYLEMELDNPATVVEEKMLNLILYDSLANQTVNAKILNIATGRELKLTFCSETNLDFYEYKIRLFFAGKEILDEHKLFQHKLKDAYKIQVMKKKFEI